MATVKTQPQLGKEKERLIWLSRSAKIGIWLMAWSISADRAWIGDMEIHASIHFHLLCILIIIIYNSPKWRSAAAPILYLNIMNRWLDKIVFLRVDDYWTQTSNLFYNRWRGCVESIQFLEYFVGGIHQCGSINSWINSLQYHLKCTRTRTPHCEEEGGGGRAGDGRLICADTSSWDRENSIAANI